MHVLSDRLRLPERFEPVAAYLRRHDPDLRLRCSVERRGCFVLERKCRRSPAVNAAMPERTDVHVQARDGYIHIAYVHPNWLLHPWNILRELREAGVDVWAAGGFQRVSDELAYEEQWAKETRRRRRREDLRAYFREAFDTLDRLGNRDGSERIRINNPGLPTAAPA